jgi:hypothetical protein
MTPFFASSKSKITKNFPGSFGIKIGMFKVFEERLTLICCQQKKKRLVKAASLKFHGVEII